MDILTYKYVCVDTYISIYIYDLHTYVYVCNTIYIYILQYIICVYCVYHMMHTYIYIIIYTHIDTSICQAFLLHTADPTLDRWSRWLHRRPSTLWLQKQEMHFASLHADHPFAHLWDPDVQVSHLREQRSHARGTSAISASATSIGQGSWRSFPGLYLWVANSSNGPVW